MKLPFNLYFRVYLPMKTMRKLCVSFVVFSLFGIGVGYGIPVLAQSTCSSLRGACESAASCQPKVSAGTHTISTEATGCSGVSVCCVPSSGVDQAITNQGKGATTVGYNLKNPLGSRTISQIVASIIRWISVIAGGLFMGYLIWGGLEWMTARGDANAIKSARGKILYSILGVIIMSISYFIIDALIQLPNLIK